MSYEYTGCRKNFQVGIYIINVFSTYIKPASFAASSLSKQLLLCFVCLLCLYMHSMDMCNMQIMSCCSYSI